MIVPGFIVNRIYKKRSLHRENGSWSFAFRNSLARGTAAVSSAESISVDSQLGSLRLLSLPTLYVDDQEVPIEQVSMVIGGTQVPHYAREDMAEHVGESLKFEKGADFVTRVTGDLPDGPHNFRVVFHTDPFGDIVLNFKDTMGEEPEPGLFQRILSWFGLAAAPASGDRIEESPRARIEAASRLFVLDGGRPEPDFGRLLAVTDLKKPDRVPLVELMVDEEVKTAFLGRPITSMADEVEFWLAMGYDFVPLMVLNVTPRNVEVISSHRTTYSENLQERAWIVEGHGAIETRDDLERADWPEAEDQLFDTFEEIGPHLPDGMKVVGCISALFETVTQAMGLEKFCLALYDDPQLVDTLFEKAGKLIGDCISRMLQFEHVGAIWITDDLSYKDGPIIQPAMLEKYVFPWYARYCETIRQAGRPPIFHSCGNVTALMEQIVSSGYAALHPLEPNSMDIYQIKKNYGDRIALWGNIDLSYMLPRGSVQEIEEDVKAHIDRLASSGGYALGSANSIPNYVPLENFKAMNRACLIHGKNLG